MTGEDSSGSPRRVRVMDVVDGSTLVVLAETRPGRFGSVRGRVHISEESWAADRETDTDDAYSCSGCRAYGADGKTTLVDPPSLELVWAARNRLVAMVTGGRFHVPVEAGRGRAGGRAIRQALALAVYTVTIAPSATEGKVLVTFEVAGKGYRR